jgi:hypothetical protein
MTNKKAQAIPNAKSPLCKAAPQMALAPPTNAPFVLLLKGSISGFATGTTGPGPRHTLGSGVPAGTGVAVDFTNRNIEYIERETFIPFWKPLLKSFLLVNQFLFFLRLLNLYYMNKLRS